jgi:hypothetical protein
LEMGKHLGRAPNIQNMNNVLHGGQPLTKRFPNALHKAFLLHEDELLDPEIWVKLSANEFRDLLIIARGLREPVEAFRNFGATSSSWLFRE